MPSKRLQSQECSPMYARTVIEVVITYSRGKGPEVLDSVKNILFICFGMAFQSCIPASCVAAFDHK